MQLGNSFPLILQEIGEAGLVEDPMRVSKLDIMDAYYCGTLRPSQAGAFAYVVPSVPEDDRVIIYIEMVLPMGWAD